MKRITPENITTLRKNEIFVFGSNEGGRHGAGAAKAAMKWGAKYGQAEGIQGSTYGIPTVDASVRNSLTPKQIKPYVDRFVAYVKFHPELKFYVTPIGCGLAGLHPKDIAPLFDGAYGLENVHYPQVFWMHSGYMDLGSNKRAKEIANAVDKECIEHLKVLAILEGGRAQDEKS